MRGYRGPRSIIGALYLVQGFYLGLPFVTFGEPRAHQLWNIYQSPTFDQNSRVLLFLVALACLAVGAIYLLSYSSDRLSECLSEDRVGRFIAGLSVALALIAMKNFADPIAQIFFSGIPLCIWSWFRSDPDDKWF